MGRAALAVRFHRNERAWLTDQSYCPGGPGGSGPGALAVAPA